MPLCAKRSTFSPRKVCRWITCAFSHSPSTQPVEAFIAEHDFCYVVEQNRDAQLRSLLLLETSAAKDKLRPILVYGGFPLSASHVSTPCS